MLTTAFILGWRAAAREQEAKPEYQMNISKKKLTEKEKEQKIILSSLEDKRKLFENSTQKLKQIEFNINSLCVKILNYNLNDTKEYKQYINTLKQSITSLTEQINLTHKIYLKQFTLDYATTNICKITREKFKEIIDTLPELIEFIKLTGFEYYNIKPIWDTSKMSKEDLLKEINILLSGCRSFQYWNIFCYKDLYKISSEEFDEKMKHFYDIDVSNYENTCREFINYQRNYIQFYNECLKYIEEYYKQFKNNFNYYDINIIKVINDYIDESKKLIILYENKTKYLLNTGENGIYINKILDDVKHKIYNKSNFNMINQLKLNIETKLIKTNSEIIQQVNKITSLSININQFESLIYENGINSDFINSYKHIKTNIDKILDYVLNKYEQSLINNKILLLQIDKCYELKLNYELEKEYKEIEDKNTKINKEIIDLKEYIETKRLECIYGTL